MNITNIFSAMFLNGFAVLGLAYAGCSVTTAVFFMSTSLCLHGAVSSATLASIVDIAPNYAGITLGLVSTIAIMSGFVSPIIVGYITFENQSVEAWRHIFQICAVMLIVTGSMYIWLNDTTLQAWNKPPKSSDDPKELKPLNKSKSADVFVKNGNDEQN